MLTTTGETFLRQISGALRDTINSYGDITLGTVGSSAKRIQRTIYGYLKSERLKEITESDIFSEKDKEIDRLKDKVITQAKTIQDLLTKLEATGTFKRTGK